MAKLSIVIPTYNAAHTLGPTLAALAQIEAVGLIKEVIVTDGGSTDGTLAGARETGAVLVNSDRGRGPQLRTGASAATASWLLFLHADTVLDAGWSDAVKRFINRSDAPAKAGYFCYALQDHTTSARYLERIVRWRNRVLALPYGDQGLLISRILYDQLGGYRPLPLMEDVDFVRRLGRGRLRPLEATAVTSPDRYQREGYLTRSARNLFCLGLYYIGVPPRIIRQIYE
ncbi:MAG: hypothetical protein CFH10_01603 [Alphaproteobacteria bacterium MarineAlpha4_Bin2]|nr:MAG: hypothetical protein CFH10_01603 [Alphaproteobacteria bacterium MarineAlpha4_Bin2]